MGTTKDVVVWLDVAGGLDLVVGVVVVVIGVKGLVSRKGRSLDCHRICIANALLLPLVQRLWYVELHSKRL